MTQISLGLGLNYSAPRAPAWQSRGLIAARMTAPYTTTGTQRANSGGKTAIYENSRHVVAVDASSPSVVFQNVRADALGTGDFTVKAALLTHDGLVEDGGGDTPIDYQVAGWMGGSDSGRRSPAIASGAYLESAPFTLAGLVAGNLLRSRHHHIWATAPAAFPGGDLNKYVGDESVNIGDALAERIDSFFDWWGGYYAEDGADTYDYAGPAVVIGDTAARRARICIINDSIGMGAGEVGGGNYVGWLQRLLQANYPWYLVGNSGYSLDQLMADDAERARRLALLVPAGITHVLAQVVTNDLIAGLTASQFLDRAAALQAELDALPLQPRLVLCTATPSTDGSNTTPSSDAGERDSLNQAIRDNRGVGWGYLDAAQYSFASGGTQLWDTGGGRGTADGLHPNPAMHAYIASQLVAVLPGLLGVEHYT